MLILQIAAGIVLGYFIIKKSSFILSASKIAFISLIVLILALLLLSFTIQHWEKISPLVIVLAASLIAFLIKLAEEKTGIFDKLSNSKLNKEITCFFHRFIK